VRRQRGVQAAAAVQQQVLRPIRGTRWSRVLEVAACAASILLFAGAVLGLSGPVWSTVLIGWVCALATAAFVMLFVQDRRTARRSRYATSVDRLHETLHALRDGSAALLLRDANAADVLPSVGQTVTAAAEMFTIITGSVCRTCVKELGRSGEGAGTVDAPGTAQGDELRKLEVTTMVRSGGVPSPADGVRHFVDQNTDFESLFLNPSLRWFHSNDLASLEAYKNSSWVGDGPREYASTCVWPIEKRDAFAPGNHDILGLLCVDTRDTNVFDERFDFWIGAALADALYPVMKMLHRQAEGIRYVPADRE